MGRRDQARKGSDPPPGVPVPGSPIGPPLVAVPVLNFPTKPKSKLAAVPKFLLTSALAGTIAAAMCLPIVVPAALATKSTVANFETLPSSLSNYALPERTYMLAADGTQIATLYTENRVTVPLTQISPLLQKAIIDIEDVRFYQHHGVDAKAVLRAFVANSAAGDVSQGSSTITMQYVRNLLITNATTPDQITAARVQTLERKIQEMKYAISLEKQLSKADILSGYLNVAYFGGGAYGVQAASKRYFNQSAADLTLPQAATLAGLVQQPASYNPITNPAAAQARRNTVLDRMLLNKDITAAQATSAKAIPIAATLSPHQTVNGCASGPYPFYCEFVLNQIKNDPRYGQTPEDRTELLSRGGITIMTSLDTAKQAIAQHTVDSYIPPTDPSRKATAVAMVEPGTGLVRRLWVLWVVNECAFCLLILHNSR